MRRGRLGRLAAAVLVVFVSAVVAPAAPVSAATCTTPWWPTTGQTATSDINGVRTLNTTFTVTRTMRDNVTACGGWLRIYHYVLSSGSSGAANYTLQTNVPGKKHISPTGAFAPGVTYIQVGNLHDQQYYINVSWSGTTAGPTFSLYVVPLRWAYPGFEQNRCRQTTNPDYGGCLYPPTPTTQPWQIFGGQKPLNGATYLFP